MEDSLMHRDDLSGIRISRHLTLVELEHLSRGQRVRDEEGRSAILLNIEIKAHGRELLSL
jgi:hypothetical protein